MWHGWLLQTGPPQFVPAPNPVTDPTTWVTSVAVGVAWGLLLGVLARPAWSGGPAWLPKTGSARLWHVLYGVAITAAATLLYAVGYELTGTKTLGGSFGMALYAAAVTGMVLGAAMWRAPQERRHTIMRAHALASLVLLALCAVLFLAVSWWMRDYSLF